MYLGSLRLPVPLGVIIIPGKPRERAPVYVCARAGACGSFAVRLLQPRSCPAGHFCPSLPSSTLGPASAPHLGPGRPPRGRSGVLGSWRARRRSAPESRRASRARAGTGARLHAWPQRCGVRLGRLPAAEPPRSPLQPTAVRTSGADPRARRAQARGGAWPVRPRLAPGRSPPPLRNRRSELLGLVSPTLSRSVSACDRPEGSPAANQPSAPGRQRQCVGATASPSPATRRV